MDPSCDVIGLSLPKSSLAFAGACSLSPWEVVAQLPALTVEYQVCVVQ
jgi:hypothetical protein